ncbi:MAG TPA: hypothetical protein VKS78_19685 [Roseiarcus sp.]|nr:hypothetical protein [Roseiarcus sp.]
MQRPAPAHQSLAPRVVDLAASAALAFVLTALPVLIHLINPSAAIAFSLVSACAAALYFERATPMIILTSYMFQTMFVAMASSYAAQFSDLDSMKAYDFVTTVGIWLTMAARILAGRIVVSPFVWRMLFATTAILALAGLYFVAGLAMNARGATIYMRNIGLPVLLFQIGVVVASRHRLAMRETATFLLGLLTLCGYFELVAPEYWLDFTNGWNYWDLGSLSARDSGQFETAARQTGLVATGVLDFLKSDIFNTNLLAGLDLRLVRLQGPNFHPISFGYSLALMIAFAAVQGQRALPLAAAPLLLFVGAKGAATLLAFTWIFCLVARFRTGALPLVGLAAVMALYALFVFRTGLESGDFHVLGLIGGFNGFLTNPIGHTLGQGGNLSTNFAALDWSRFQSAGAADTAVESAVGVMIYQMGIAAFGVLAIYLWLARTAWRLFEILRAPALALAASSIVVILVNGLFQEEALFAPLALGLALFLAGLTLGAVDRRICAEQRSAVTRIGDLRDAGAAA